MKQTELSLVSNGANFRVFAQDTQVGEIVFGLHVGSYGVVIISDNHVYAYSVSAPVGVHLDPQDAIDRLLDAFVKSKTKYRVLIQGAVSCVQYNQCYMMLCVNNSALMLLALHPFTGTGSFAFQPKDAEGHDLPHYHYVTPVELELMKPDLNLTSLVHSAGWCASKY